MTFAYEVADRCVFLDGGRVVEHGPPHQFFDAPRTERLRLFLSRFRQQRARPGRDGPE
jgi:ABC-type polar amino acid transport system ATPase subunit